MLFHLAGLPQEEVAGRLGTGGGAVRTRLHKARAAMRARLTPPERTRMLPATIADIRRTPAGRHVVLLATESDRLPIWIGRPEAEALAAGLHQVELPRPSAHALALSLVKATGHAVAGVRVVKLDAETFYAEVVLDDGSAVDARPSDALALAVATGVADRDRRGGDGGRGRRRRPTSTPRTWPRPPRAAPRCIAGEVREAMSRPRLVSGAGPMTVA